MSTVFLVVSGRFEGYDVESVWSTRELAEAEVARRKREPDPDDDEERGVNPRVVEHYLDANGGERTRWIVYWSLIRPISVPTPSGPEITVERESPRGWVGHDEFHDLYAIVYVDAADETSARDAGLARIASWRAAKGLSAP